MNACELTLIVLRCAYLERSRRFFAAVGLRLQQEQHDRGPVHYSAALGDVVLELYPHVEQASPSSVRLGFRVPEVRVVVEAVRQAHAGEVVRFSDENSAHALLRDADGRAVHIEAAQA